MCAFRRPPTSSSTAPPAQKPAPASRSAPDAHTAEAVSDAVGKLLTEDTYRDAARRVSGEIAAMPSPAEVADKLDAAYG